MTKIFEKLKKKWGLASTGEVFVILAIFSLAGPSDSFVVKSLLHSVFKSISALPLGLRIAVYVLIAVPLYQCFLLIYGFLFGKFDFFWKRQKKTLQFFASLPRRLALQKSGSDVNP